MRALAIVMLLVAGSASASAQSTHALIVTGLAGEPRLAQQFAHDAAAIRDGVVKRFGGDAVILSESSMPRSDKAGIAQALQKLAADSKPGDHVLIVLIGHGSAAGSDVRFNIPGPDIEAVELARLLDPLRTRDMAVVVATSASGAFLSALSTAGRTVITATRSAAENEEVVFPQFFAKALSEDLADTDKDGGVSMAEAFEYAHREVARFYQQSNRLATEHAMLDDNGDAQGSMALTPEGEDGGHARAFVLRSPTSALANPELAAIQKQIDELKQRKSTMAADAYNSELEKLLLQLARKTQELRSSGRNN